VIWIGALITLVGSLVVAVGRAGKRGMISPEARFGIRTPATGASREAWYAAHEVAGPWITAGGWVVTIGGVIIMLGQPSGADTLRIAVFATVLAAAAVVWGVVVGNRAASAERDGDGSP
jgi:uncharacterized membrane protein